VERDACVEREGMAVQSNVRGWPCNLGAHEAAEIQRWKASESYEQQHAYQRRCW
jgi:hypothetical protein